MRRFPKHPLRQNGADGCDKSSRDRIGIDSKEEAALPPLRKGANMNSVGFSQYVTAIFVSPLYFALLRRWGAATVNGFFYGLAIVTLPVFGIGFFFWFFCVLHAAWDLRRRITEEAATLMASKMADELYARRQTEEGSQAQRSQSGL